MLFCFLYIRITPSHQIHFGPFSFQTGINQMAESGEGSASALLLFSFSYNLETVHSKMEINFP